MTNKQVIVSGVRPTGDLHIGNYLGAISQFVELQKKYKTYFFIADLHAVTQPQDPKEFANQTLDIAALYLACGLDPKKTTLFIQSHVPEHLELAWFLGTLAPMGELNRMTQYKEKIQEGKPANFGLFAYPVLMAADILIYKADAVPVGEDQVQHLEFARTIARKLNEKCAEAILKEPKPILQKEVARVMALDNPEKKMSKSADTSDNYISLMDGPLEIHRKIKIAVTDSGKEIKYDTELKPGISNLISIYSAFSKNSIQNIEAKYAGKNYGEFKNGLAELVISNLGPIQNKYKTLAKNKKGLIKVLDNGSTKAQKIAQKTLFEVKTKMGFLV